MDRTERREQFSSEKANIFAMGIGESGACLQQIDTKIDGMRLAFSDKKLPPCGFSACVNPLPGESVHDGIGNNFLHRWTRVPARISGLSGFAPALHSFR
jgi:hypothetical protein